MTSVCLSGFAGQAQLLAIAQSIPSALLVFVACAIPVGAYGVLREDLSSGLFAAAAFVLLSLELTMVSCFFSTPPPGADAVLPAALHVSLHTITQLADIFHEV